MLVQKAIKTTTGCSTRWWRRLFGSSRPTADSAAAAIHLDFSDMTVAPDVRASAHEDGLTILDISTGQMFLCNETGARIWQGIAAGLSVDDISDEISRECGVGRPLVRRHASSFLGELARRGLLVQKAES